MLKINCKEKRTVGKANKGAQAFGSFQGSYLTLSFGTHYSFASHLLVLLSCLSPQSPLEVSLGAYTFVDLIPRWVFRVPTRVQSPVLLVPTLPGL